MSRKKMTAFEALGVSEDEMLVNFLTLYAQASEEQVDIGRQWFPRAHNIARHLNHLFEYGLENTIAVLAACSPQCPWLWSDSDPRCNVYKAIQVLMSEEEDRPKNFWSSNAIWKRAQHLKSLHGTDLKAALATKGFKIKAFYDSILTGGTGEIPCIDTHMMNAGVNGAPLTETQRMRIFLDEQRYAQFANVIVTAANTVGEAPQAMQAILWTVWRDAHGRA